MVCFEISVFSSNFNLDFIYSTLLRYLNSLSVDFLKILLKLYHLQYFLLQYLFLIFCLSVLALISSSISECMSSNYSWLYKALPLCFTFK